MLIGEGVSCRTSYSIVNYLYVSCSGLFTSDLEERERERERELFFCYRLLLIMWFLFGGISSSSWCLGKVAFFIVALPVPSI